MKFEMKLRELFDPLYGEVDFVKRTYAALKDHGFSDTNTIAATCICRDEISQTLRSIIKHMWGGEAFNLSSLAGMFFAGKTGLLAAMHHAPVTGGRERYVFYALPHVAIGAEGQIGMCKRTGREGESTACGALNAFQREMAGGRLNLSLDSEDVEQSLIKQRLLRDIPYGHVPDLFELTKITHKAIHTDLESVISKIVDPGKSDYALITGIQIHGPENNYVWPGVCYAVVQGTKRNLTL